MIEQTLQWSLCDHSCVHTNLMGLCASAVCGSLEDYTLCQWEFHIQFFSKNQVVIIRVHAATMSHSQINSERKWSLNIKMHNSICGNHRGICNTALKFLFYNQCQYSTVFSIFRIGCFWSTYARKNNAHSKTIVGLFRQLTVSSPLIIAIFSLFC